MSDRLLEKRLLSYLNLRRSLTSMLFAATLIMLLAACSSLIGPRNFRLSEAELTELVAKQFPYDRRFLEVFDVRVAAPRLTLLPEANRIATELPLEASDRLFGHVYKGQLSLDYGLRYDEQDHSIRLSQVRVNQLVFDGASTPMQPVVNRLGGLLAEQLLKDLAIYRFKPEDLKRAQDRGYQPGDLKVTSRGVEMALNPKP